MVNILYLAYGNNPNIYSQVYFSMASVRVYHPETPIHIITDAPQYFKRISGQPYFFIHHIPTETIQEWMNTGQKKFVFRTKQKAMEWMISRFPEHPLLYFDSDTFIYQSMAPVFEILERNEGAVMHEYENLLSKPTTKTQRIVWKVVGAKTIASVCISKHHAMWNAGVVGIPAHRNQEALKLAINLSDELVNQIQRNWYVEQMAFSIVLSDFYGLSESKNYVAHYWGSKDEWDAAIQKFYVMSYFKQLVLEKELELIKTFDFSSIPVRKRQNNTRVRLVNLVNKCFKDKYVEYLLQNK